MYIYICLCVCVHVRAACRRLKEKIKSDVDMVKVKLTDIGSSDIGFSVYNIQNIINRELSSIFYMLS